MSEMAADDRDSSSDDLAYGIRLARAQVNKPGSKWHDIDQRLARAVIALHEAIGLTPEERTALLATISRLMVDDHRQAMLYYIRTARDTINVLSRLLAIPDRARRSE